MVTGDNPLTACNVAKVLKFTRRRVPTLVLDEPLDKCAAWKWKVSFRSYSSVSSIVCEWL